MPTYSGSTIFDLITKNRIADGTHTFTLTSGTTQSITNVAVKNFYGSYFYSGQPDAFSDITSDDTFMCVRIFHGKLTINSAQTFDPPRRTRGFFVFVKGDLENNGHITMTRKGSSAAVPSADLQIWGTALIPRAGQSGGDSVRTSTAANVSVPGKSPEQSIKPLPPRGTGGGGSGSARKLGTASVWSETVAGSAGTMWSGGFGSGGITSGASNQTGLGPNSTTGGEARVSTTAAGPFYVGSGSGVFAGTAKLRDGSTTDVSTQPYKPLDGTAGLLMIACLGSFINNGQVTSVGTDGGRGSEDHGNGGSSGGGSINIVYKTTSGSGSSSVSGGAAVTAGYTTPGNNAGGAGGTGSYTALSFTQESITLPRRTLIKTSDGKLWYRNFSLLTWQEATGTGTTPFETFGMFDDEVYLLDKAMIQGINGININAVTIQTYTPS